MTPHEAARLEIMLGGIEADLTTARQNVAEAAETDFRVLTAISERRARMNESVRIEVAFNHARYGQTGER